MFDPLRVKSRVIVTISLGFVGGLGLASVLGWTGPSYAMPTITEAPQITEEAVRPALDLSEAFANVAQPVTPAVVRIEATSTRRMSSASSSTCPRGRNTRRFPEWAGDPASSSPRTDIS